jgi:VWFA-related protein
MPMPPLNRRELLTRAALLVAGGVVVRAQSPPGQQRPTFSGGIEVVNISVTAREKNGRLVTDLSRDEFVVNEDGRPQAITFFSRENDLPLTIGLLVDTTPSESNMLDVERRASLAFLSRMLRPATDKAFLVQYYSQIELVQGLTSARSELEDGLDRLKAHPPKGGRGGRGGPGGGRSDGRGIPQPPGGEYETVLADAVFSSAREIMQQQSGRKALLVLGDGDHVGDRLQRAVAAAQDAETLVYAIRIYDKDFEGGSSVPPGAGIRLPGGITIGPAGSPGGRGGFGGGPPGGAPVGGPGGGRGGSDPGREKENLKELARQTGGAYFEVGKKDTLEQIYGQIEEELRSQYSLGYTPDARAVDGFRKIQVSVRRKGVLVRAREGYYARR